MKKLYFIFYGLLGFCLNIYAQPWLEDIYRSEDNYYEIRSRFDKHWETHARNEKGSGYKPFMRWAEFAEPRVYPTGDLSLLNLTAKNYQEFLKQYRSPAGHRSSMSASITWTAMGPMGSQKGPVTSSLIPVMQVGRANFMTIDPTNPLNLWVGTPGGGLWKSTNGGNSWTTNTDNLLVSGCSDLAIDPTNTNIMYLATGDAYGFVCPSFGILKSTDGGQTWNSTGLISPLASALYIRRLIINPQNPQILIAATNTGLHRTTDGGATWTQVTAFWAHDVEFNISNPSIVYATGGSNCYISNNGGSSFTLMNNNGSPTGGGRTLIAVTPADPNYVYLLAIQQNWNLFMGLYRSTDAGATFSLMSTSPNIVSAQGYFNLALAVSSIDKNEVVGGGVRLYKSLNGGSTWTLFANASTTHVDNHDVKYAPNGMLYSMNDGGIYSFPPNGSGWSEISGTMNISQIYRMGASALTPGKWISGHQDNGNNIRTGPGSYIGVTGADGMDSFYDRTNDNNVFASTEGGLMRRSTDGGNTWSYTALGISSLWTTPWCQDPVSANVLYLGANNLYKSTDLGITWTQLGNSFSGGMVDFKIAPSNNQVIYTIEGAVVNRTANGGTTWSVVTGNIPTNTAQAVGLCVNPHDPNHVWVVLSGYSAGNKVYMTTNGGTTWTNVSGNLPNIPADCIIYEPNSPDRVYVGMDAGVYYMDNTTNGSWILYNNGLPNTPVRDFEISPATPGILYAATFGRGVYAVSLVGAPTPVGHFISSANATVCAGTAITFSDQSSNAPTSWNWDIQPANGASISSSNLQNLTVFFSSPGIYTVSLRASNANGQGATVSHTINISTCNGAGTLLLRNQEFSIFPNPNKGSLNIRSNDLPSEDLQLTVVNIAGKVVATHSLRFFLSQPIKEIDIGQLAPGAYFITLSSGKESSQTIRIIKE